MLTSFVNGPSFQRRQVASQAELRDSVAATGSIVLDLDLIEEDATVPEQVAQEIIINKGNITHIAAGPYSGFLQVS